MLGSLEEKILSGYNEIDLGTCEVCTRCHSDNPTLYSKAVGMWFVGKFFEDQKNRVLFIGKNARGMPATEYKENQNSNGFLAEFRYSRENLIDKSWPYWSYTKEISKRLFGDMAMEAVAFTNMVKCNGSDTIDTTTESMKGYCIGDLAVVRREIEIIKPTHIVLYTGTFRGHGFRGKALIPMLKAYVGKVDWLICEGTMLSRGPETVKSERQLQGDERSLMEQNKRVFVVCSSMNIDRIAGFCKAVPDRRPILCDDFQKKALDIVQIRHGVYTSLYDFSRVRVYYQNSVKLNQWMEDKGFLCFIRANYFSDLLLERYGTGSVIAYSMWAGYLSGATENERLSALLAGRNWVQMHTSGHATVAHLREVYDTVSPSCGVIPIHTDRPDTFLSVFPANAVSLLADGQQKML